ncbi:MAG: ATP-dependent Clp protease proteolytic subunit, partial [Pseudomonadales bacterium]|jgi:ATP-dependent protease ClpP protease subunit|nr:ATP-dependent Clp protease proteolytic subunit [Pseudomonadales bacterium]
MDALTIVRELEALDTEVITVRIHSPGGYITEGLALYNALRGARKPVHVYIDGICASMATVVAMAASKGHLYTPDNALWMIHKPWGSVDGNAEQLREYAGNLDVLERSMIAAYVSSGRVSEERIKEILATGKDFYMTGTEAIQEGFADDYTGDIKAVAASIDLGALQPDQAHQTLFNFYAVTAAPTNVNHHEDRTMEELKKLLALKAAKAAAGVAAADINAALAKAFGVAATEVEALLTEAGKATAKQLADAQAALAALQAPAPVIPAPAPVNPAPAPASADAMAAAIALERTRVAEITALARRFDLPASRQEELLNTGASLEQARAAIIDYLGSADRQRQPVPGVRIIDTTAEAFRASMGNAMLHRMQPARFQLEEGGRDFRGMSLLSMAAECLERAGIRTRGLSRNELAAQAMHTRSDFPAIVADVANQILLRAYQAQPRSFFEIATQTTLSNFKRKHAVEIGGGSDLKEVNEAGEFEHGTVSEGSRSYKLSTVGRIFAFTRQLLIDDDIGAFNQFMANVGALAARKESSIVWGLVKAGGIFSSQNKNLVQGGGVPGEEQLSKIRKLLRQQTGLDGEPINIAGRYLVVNSELETVAQKLLSAVLAAATEDVNVFANSLQLIVEPLLDGVTNNPWYVFADPSLVPTLEYAYLEGETGPYIETRNGFEVDGIQIKVRHDFGAGWVSHRGAVKNPGA